MSENSNTLLRVEDLRLQFETEDSVVDAVKGINFSIQQGEILGLVGESGSGKTVTGMSILGLIPKPVGKLCSGRLYYKGQDLLKLSYDELRKIRGQEIGVIFQEPMTALSPLQTVGNQMAEAIRLHDSEIKKAEALLLAEEWLTKVGIPDAKKRLNDFPYQFSGGMRQRVMIAMVLMMDPSLIIADEPTTALDVTTQRQIFELILKIKKKDSSILFVTHDMGVIWQLCDRVMVMRKGELLEQEDCQQLFMNPLHEYTKTLLEAVPKLSDDALVEACDSSETLLDVQNLKTWFPVRKGIFSKTVGHIKAVDDVSFSVRKGEILAIVGESGSGKTTLGRTILGLESSHKGSIQFKGKELTELSSTEYKAIRKNLQIIFQDPYSSLNPKQTILQVLTEGVIEHAMLEGDAEAYAAKLLLDVGLEAEHMYRYPHEFSGGQRQRICIARTLSMKPDFIVCDEVVSALDVTIQSQILKLLLDLQKKYNLSYLFITHDLAVVKWIAHRVIVMQKGKIVETGDTKELIHNPQNAYTKELLSAVPIPGCEDSRNSLRASLSDS